MEEGPGRKLRQCISECHLKAAFFLFTVIDRAFTCCMAHGPPFRFRLPHEGELFVARSCRASEDDPLRRLSSRISGIHKTT